VEAEGVPGVDDTLGIGPTVNVCPLVVTVVGPVIEEPGGRVNVTGFPSAPVRVTTFDVEAEEAPGVDDALGVGPTVNVCPLVVTVVGPVIKTPGGSVSVTGVPDGPVSVAMLDCKEEGDVLTVPITVLGVDVSPGTDVAFADEVC